MAAATLAAAVSVAGSGRLVASDYLRATAEATIQNNFDPEICPAVLAANKGKDGIVEAVCSNGETFLLMGSVSLRCSAAQANFPDVVAPCTRWGSDPIKLRREMDAARGPTILRGGRGDGR